MLRLVLLVVLLLLLLRFLLLLARRVAAALRAGADAPGGATVPLVPCRRCGVHVPLPRALAERDGAYLCRDCAVR